jgi:branched-chain amino acid transport system substrate-binding protein
MVPLRSAHAQRPKIRIGVLTDLSGPYRDITGPTSVVCVRQAVEDFGLAANTFDVEVTSADHQNQADIGVAIARSWIDNDSVDVIADVPNSAVALAVAQVARDKDRVHLSSGALTAALTDAQCSPNTVMWSSDTYLLAKSTGGAMVQSGGDSWFLITADYAFGHSLEEMAVAVVKKAGGKVLGARCATRSRKRAISQAICNRHRRAARRCWVWPIPGPIPWIASNRHTSSGYPRAAYA